MNQHTAQYVNLQYLSTFITATQAIHADFNQYPRPAGDPMLVAALADHYGPLLNRVIEPMTEVTITVGATEAIYSIMQAMINEGDEVIVFEPAFDMFVCFPEFSLGAGLSVILIGLLISLLSLFRRNTVRNFCIK